MTSLTQPLGLHLLTSWVVAAEDQSYWLGLGFALGQAPTLRRRLPQRVLA